MSSLCHLGHHHGQWSSSSSFQPPSLSAGADAFLGLDRNPPGEGKTCFDKLKSKYLQIIPSSAFLSSKKIDFKATFNAARSAFLADRPKKDLLRELRKEFGMEDKVSLFFLMLLLLTAIFVKVELEILINHNCGGANGAPSEEDVVQKKLKVSF